jgi:hypothetical protein
VSPGKTLPVIYIVMDKNWLGKYRQKLSSVKAKERASKRNCTSIYHEVFIN